MSSLSVGSGKGYDGINSLTKKSLDLVLGYKVMRLAAPSFDFVFLLLAQESPSELGSPFARSSFPTLGRASELSLLSLIGNVLR